jgi:hypothetical protein
LIERRKERDEAERKRQFENYQKAPSCVQKTLVEADSSWPVIKKSKGFPISWRRRPT